MIELAGNYSLLATFLLALLGALAGAAAWRNPRWLPHARLAAIWTVPLLTISSAALLIALVKSDMRFAYVAAHSEHALPTEYKLAAFWAGQEGSILLWAWMLSIMTAIAAITRRKLDARGEPVTLATLSAINAFFAALMLFAANPFLLVPGGAPVDGRGLNPLLQHWAMTLHPPTLFLGYAGFTIPFAIMLGALVAGEASNGWAAQMRRWTLFAWTSLGAGIMLGAWWAYVELGWGGYWAWDPVENASLLPWLTGTAMLHSLIIQQQRGVYRAWSSVLASLTFILCIVATWITRSGAIESVHAFGESVVGTFFLAFILLASVISAAVITWHWPQLRTRTPIESVLSREAMFLAANVLLLIMTGATLVGTMFPLISGIFMSESISVGQGYYNRVVAPMGLLVVALMALGPVLIYGKDAAQSVRRGVLIPGAITLAILILTVALGLRSIAAMVCVVIASMTLLVILFTLIASIRSYRDMRGGNVLAVAARLIDTNHRRYGGQLAHAGMAVMVIGIAGSSLFSDHRDVTLRPGETVEVGRYTLTYNTLREEQGPNYTAVQAVVQLVAGDTRVELAPERRFYLKAENPAAEVAIRTNWREDLYVALVGWQGGGQSVALQIMVNPLTMWVWIGATITILAGVLCMLPRLLPASRRVPAASSRPVVTVPAPQIAPEAVAAH